MTRTVFLISALVALGAFPADAQDPTPPDPVRDSAPNPAQPQEPELVDGIVAVVGDSVILASELDEQIERRRATGQPVPTDPAELEQLRRAELESLINELVMIQAAERDSILVPEEDVQGQVDAAIEEQVRRFGSQPAFEEALSREGLTLEQYRAIVARGTRRAGIQQQFVAMVQRDRSPPRVSDEEIREFFEQRRTELGRRPATIEFRQVVVTPEPADSAMARARAEAESILEELAEGEDFETLARRHSDDPGSRQQGGELGWFRRGRFVPEFERVAFALPPGAHSGIVETPFGLHIIKVERARGAERLARHILIRPEITAEDRARTRARARDVAEALRSGASVDSMIEAVHDPVEQSRIGPVVRDSLPAPWRSQLRNVSAGDVVGPFQIPGAEDAFTVAHVDDVTEAGEYTLEDQELRAQIRQFLQREKLLEEVLTELRRTTYIDIRF